MAVTDSRAFGVGIVGCGNIFERYMTGLARFPYLRVVACTDADRTRAERAGEAFGIRAWQTVDELLADPDVDIVVNITPPLAHAGVSMAALAAGKSVYSEKPLAATLEDAAAVLACARSAGVPIGCATDTFLGSAAQTARAALDAGLIGAPIGMAAFVTHTQPELWHPDPTFLFTAGGGPLLDMGPYYIASLVNCLGAVTQVAGATRIGATPRIVTAPDRRVETIEVTVPTHATAVLRFVNNVVGVVMMSFDVWHHDLPYIEIYGSLGALRLADPNGYDGDVRVQLNHESDWRVLPPVLPQSGQPDSDDQMLRGMGVAELALSLQGGAHRTNGALAYHVLEVLTAIEVSSKTGAVVHLTSRHERPMPFEAGDLGGQLAGAPVTSAGAENQCHIPH